jgi:hypothetical protein
MPCPEPIDAEGPWWKGFYEGWRDHDEGRDPRNPGDDPSPWSAGYDAGWIAYCCEALPHRTASIPGSAAIPLGTRRPRLGGMRPVASCRAGT